MFGRIKLFFDKLFNSKKEDIDIGKDVEEDIEENIVSGFDEGIGERMGSRKDNEKKYKQIIEEHKKEMKE